MRCMFHLSVNSVAGRGKKNEDHYGSKSFENAVLIAVADGMGGTDCAKEAAKLAVNTILNSFVIDTHATEALEQAVLSANEMVADECNKRGCRMGCAIAVVFIQNDHLYYVSLGNVHIDIFINDSEEQVNRDDVYTASNGNCFLTRSISGKDLEGKIQVREKSMQGISVISLSTDGWYNHDEEDDATNVTITIDRC